MKEVVVVFGKTATPGNVKTRLSPPVSLEDAAALYDAFARDIIEMVSRVKMEREEKVDIEYEIEVVLAWDGDESDPLALFARERGWKVIHQGAGDLGGRLQRVVSTLREEGAQRLVILGTDSPTLSPEHLHLAFDFLCEQDVVFGPAFDGGYYLIGLGEIRKDVPPPEGVVFNEITWSSRQVMEQSWHRATGDGLLCELLSFWYDVDTFEDLKILRFHLEEYLAKRDPLLGQYTRQALGKSSLREIEEA